MSRAADGVPAVRCQELLERGEVVGVQRRGEATDDRPQSQRARPHLRQLVVTRAATTLATGHNLAVRYRFDDSVLDTTRYELSRGGELVHVEPQVFDVLAHLVEHRDRVVAKAELLGHVWGHQFVSESALTTRIKQVTPGRR